jgi:hypothetical protein
VLLYELGGLRVSDPMVNGDEQNAKTKNGKRLNRQALKPVADGTAAG